MLERISHPFDIGTAAHLRSRHEVRANGDLAVPARTLVSHPVRCGIVIAADHVTQLLCLLRARHCLRIISFYLALRHFTILVVDFLAYGSSAFYLLIFTFGFNSAARSVHPFDHVAELARLLQLIKYLSAWRPSKRCLQRSVPAGHAHLHSFANIVVTLPHRRHCCTLSAVEWILDWLERAVTRLG